MTSLEEAVATITARVDQALEEQRDGRGAVRTLGQLNRQLRDLHSRAIATNELRLALHIARQRAAVRGALGLRREEPA